MGVWKKLFGKKADGSDEQATQKENEPPGQEKHMAEDDPLQAELRVNLGGGVDMEFMRIPAGEFWMGSDPQVDDRAQAAEQPRHKVYLDEYLVGKYPVTVAQFGAFLKASGYKWSWMSAEEMVEKKDHPVVEVSWEDAHTFCEWVSKVSGCKVRLPSEAEWEKAARGTDGRIYPWGNEAPDENRCNYASNVGTTTPVGKYSPQGDSPYGCADMGGNVYDWVADWFDENYYKNSPARNPAGSLQGQYRVLRGGSWGLNDYHVRAAHRGGVVPSFRFYIYGFRCAIGETPVFPSLTVR
jgi:formylglycine-generating enzyme required for sulfatase activity